MEADIQYIVYYVCHVFENANASIAMSSNDEARKTKSIFRPKAC